jgi:hypothetical protein
MSGEDAGLRAMVRSLPEEAQQLLRQVEWVGNLRHERVLAVWPDVVRIK